MIAEHESERNRKALMYTGIICALLLILFILISWKIEPPKEPVALDLIEINLGNFEEGLGDVQPLIKGERGPSQENIEQPKAAASEPEETDNVIPDDNADADAAPVNKPSKVPVKAKPAIVQPSVPVTPKPQKPKFAYDGPGKQTGNNPDEDNGYKSQGTKPGPGDAGDPSGNKDSYGSTPGGRIGGGPIVRGNRKIIRHYAFTGDLKKATIYAIVRVSPAGQGTFVRFDKGSTSQSNQYAQAISNYLRNIQFDKSSQESTVQVQFNFNEN